VSLAAGINLCPSCLSLWLQGQLFGLMSALESIATAFTPWVANSIYYASPTSLPGLIWLVQAAEMTVAVALVVFAWKETSTPPTEGLMIGQTASDASAGRGLTPGGDGVLEMSPVARGAGDKTAPLGSSV
jgi:hypothetical protein